MVLSKNSFGQRWLSPPGKIGPYAYDWGAYSAPQTTLPKTSSLLSA